VRTPPNDHASVTSSPSESTLRQVQTQVSQCHRLTGFDPAARQYDSTHSPRMFVIHLDSPARLRAKPFRKIQPRSRVGGSRTSGRGRCLRGPCDRPRSFRNPRKNQPIPNRPASSGLSSNENPYRTFVSCLKAMTRLSRSRGISDENRTSSSTALAETE